jgi:RNA polymerase sigma-70 factor (ECF subfamily)
MSDPKRYDQFVALLRRSTGQLLTYVHALLLDWDDAEDVFQETCIVLWQKFDTFQPGTNFLGWALRVAQNKAMNFQTTRARRRSLWSPTVQLALIAEMTDRRSEGAGGSLATLTACLERLGDADRELVERCYGDGVPVRQLAEQMGRSPQSVHNSLRRIRFALLECIQRVANQEDGE